MESTSSGAAARCILETVFAPPPPPAGVRHPSPALPRLRLSHTTDKSAFFSNSPPLQLSLSIFLPLLILIKTTRLCRAFPPPPPPAVGSQTSLSRDDIYAATSQEKYRAMRISRASSLSLSLCHLRAHAAITCTRGHARTRAYPTARGPSSAACFCSRIN